MQPLHHHARVYHRVHMLVACRYHCKINNSCGVLSCLHFVQSNAHASLLQARAGGALPGGGGGGGGGGSPVQRVVERTVEVDPDVEAIKAKMKAELEAKMKQARKATGAQG